jgi:hypothetical protein
MNDDLSAMSTANIDGDGVYNSSESKKKREGESNPGPIQIRA